MVRPQLHTPLYLSSNIQQNLIHPKPLSRPKSLENAKNGFAGLAVRLPPTASTSSARV
jgi:hypothetical protein